MRSWKGARETNIAGGGARLRLEDAHAFQVCCSAAPRDAIARREVSLALRLDVSLAPKMEAHSVSCKGPTKQTQQGCSSVTLVWQQRLALGCLSRLPRPFDLAPMRVWLKPTLSWGPFELMSAQLGAA